MCTFSPHCEYNVVVASNSACNIPHRKMKKTELIDRLSKAKELNKAELAKELDSLIEELQSSGPDNGKVAHFVHIHEKVTDPAKKYPRQMLVCFDALAKAEKPTMTLDEVKAAIGEAKEELQTRQDPYNVFAFYQGRMVEEGWITKEKVRV